VALKRAFREILPLLWLKAGAIGPRPELPRGEPEPALFVPPDNPFAVLLDKGRLAELIAALADRTDLRIVYIVTDGADAFKEMAAELDDSLGKRNPGLQSVQLYRDYLENLLMRRSSGSRICRSSTSRLGSSWISTGARLERSCCW
jgi:adenine-specific DNA-methyltransferase